MSPRRFDELAVGTRFTVAGVRGGNVLTKDSTLTATEELPDRTRRAAFATWTPCLVVEPKGEGTV